MCVYIYFFNVAFPQRSQSLEMSTNILADFARVGQAWSYTLLSPAGCVLSPSPANILAACLAKPRGSGQLRTCFSFILVEAGVAERYLLEKTENLESLVLWQQYECAWYQTRSRAASDCQESMASYQPRAEMQERWGKLYATWKVCVFLIHVPKSITPRHMHVEMQESTFGHCTELLQRTFPLSPSSFYSLTCHWKV